MTPRGPQPKPTLQKRLEGNPGNRRLNGAEVQPAAGITRPSHLSGAAAGKFDEIVASFPSGFFSAVDGDLIASYAVAWLFYWQASDTLSKEGQITKGSKKQQRRHPALDAQRLHFGIMKEAGDRLGLSPAARARLSMPEDQNPHGEFAGLIGATRGSGDTIN